MADYRRVYDSRHCRLPESEPGSAPEPYARQSNMGFFSSVHAARLDGTKLSLWVVSGGVNWVCNCWRQSLRILNSLNNLSSAELGLYPVDYTIESALAYTASSGRVAAVEWLVLFVFKYSEKQFVENPIHTADADTSTVSCRAVILDDSRLSPTEKLHNCLLLFLSISVFYF